MNVPAPSLTSFRSPVSDIAEFVIVAPPATSTTSSPPATLEVTVNGLNPPTIESGNVSVRPATSIVTPAPGVKSNPLAMSAVPLPAGSVKLPVSRYSNGDTSFARTARYSS